VAAWARWVPDARAVVAGGEVQHQEISHGDLLVAGRTGRQVRRKIYSTTAGLCHPFGLRPFVSSGMPRVYRLGLAQEVDPEEETVKQTCNNELSRPTT
jgi:hypothetical protein